MSGGKSDSTETLNSSNEISFTSTDPDAIPTSGTLDIFPNYYGLAQYLPPVSVNGKSYNPQFRFIDDPKFPDWSENMKVYLSGPRIAGGTFTEKWDRFNPQANPDPSCSTKKSPAGLHLIISEPIDSAITDNGWEVNLGPNYEIEWSLKPFTTLSTPILVSGGGKKRKYRKKTRRNRRY
jgi:hypothetical protein